jgi:hypothetical protein
MFVILQMHLVQRSLKSLWSLKALKDVRQYLRPCPYLVGSKLTVELSFGM